MTSEAEFDNWLEAFTTPTARYSMVVSAVLALSAHILLPFAATTSSRIVLPIRSIHYSSSMLVESTDQAHIEVASFPDDFQDTNPGLGLSGSQLLFALFVFGWTMAFTRVQPFDIASILTGSFLVLVTWPSIAWVTVGDVDIVAGGTLVLALLGLPMAIFARCAYCCSQCDKLRFCLGGPISNSEPEVFLQLVDAIRRCEADQKGVPR